MVLIHNGLIAIPNPDSTKFGKNKNKNNKKTQNKDRNKTRATTTNGPEQKRTMERAVEVRAEVFV